MIMMKCGNCGHDNPPDRRFCEICGHRITASEPPEKGDLKTLQDKIASLQKKLLAKEKEIEALQQQVALATDDKKKPQGEPATDQPELKATLQELDTKELQLQSTLHELDKTRKSLTMKQAESAKAEPEPAASVHRFVIESYPIKKPAFEMTFEESQASLDLSTSNFKIRATLERDANGSLELVVHKNATINVQAPGSKRWQRHAEGTRIKVESGFVLFDSAGSMNARIDQSN
jgi:hypothetical protein